VLYFRETFNSHAKTNLEGVCPAKSCILGIEPIFDMTIAIYHGVKFEELSFWLKMLYYAIFQRNM
jgi:hypothetical protein